MKQFFNFILVFFLGLISIYFFILISKKYNIKKNNLKYYTSLQKEIEKESKDINELKNENKQLDSEISQEKINRNLLWKKKPGEEIIKIQSNKSIQIPQPPKTKNEKKPSEAWLEILMLRG